MNILVHNAETNFPVGIFRVVDHWNCSRSKWDKTDITLMVLFRSLVELRFVFMTAVNRDENFIVRTFINNESVTLCLCACADTVSPVFKRRLQLLGRQQLGRGTHEGWTDFSLSPYTDCMDAEIIGCFNYNTSLPTSRFHGERPDRYLFRSVPFVKA